jgi:nucleotide-binding universal stress UspA family protein
MNRILVGLDASPRAQVVVEAAAALAKKTGAKLVLFRAVGVPHEVPVEAYTMTPANLAALLEREAKGYLDKVAATLPGDILAGTVVHVGTPWQGICSAADHAEAELIVIGSHGYSGLDRIIGTTAGKVVNHAKQSVLVVRAALT